MAISIEAQRYAKSADDLLIVRPRIVAKYASTFLETTERRENPVEFDSALRGTDSFVISMPAGYRAEDLPAPISLYFGYASYHSQTQQLGHTLRYNRSFEIKQLQVPLEKVDELRKLFRAIRADEDRSIDRAGTKRAITVVQGGRGHRDSHFEEPVNDSPW